MAAVPDGLFRILEPMNSSTLQIIAKELSARLTGGRFGRIFQLGRSEFAVDLRLAGSRYLYIDLRPGGPAVYLINRRLRDLERSSGNPSPFALALKKRLSGAEVVSVSKLPGERILIIELTPTDEFGAVSTRRVIIQLTGRSANLFLADDKNVILDRARDTQGDGQQIGSIYSPPFRAETPLGPEGSTPADDVAAAGPRSPSEALDAYFAERVEQQRFDSLAASALAKVTAELRKREKLVRNLKSDLAAHGDAAEWKHIGDLLLANASSAVREAGQVRVIDYFKDDLPELIVEIDENESITESAEKYYRRYTKARNAAAEIVSRVEKVEGEIGELQRRRAEVERAAADGDTAFLESLSGASGKRIETAGKRARPADTNSAVRSFVSTEGFEILVGKKAKDNDVLTFKIAKSLDTWMHAADYPGSHVVVRNPNRKEIPQRTLLEAAQLAAFYSQGKTQTKAAVHYTQKKFVNKPKGAAPGLVSLASFKTILVVPEFPSAVAKKEDQN